MSKKKQHREDKAALESDAVWDLLAKAEPTKPSPTFTQDTLRAVRLEMRKTEPFRKRLFTATVFAAPALAAVTLCAVLLINKTPAPEITDTTSTLIENTETLPKPATMLNTPEEEWLNNALLSTALEQPDLFTDEELVAMIF